MDDDTNVSASNSQIQMLLEGQNVSHGEDRISKLPDDILHHVLSFCSDTHQVIKTSLLSKRWQYLWLSIPDITFNEYNWCRQKHDNFFKMIDRTFRLRNACIRKLSLFFDRYRKPDLVDEFRLSSWLLTALRLEVQELCLILPNILLLPDMGPFQLPCSLFTSKLTNLVVRMNCSLTLKAPSPVCFSSLRVLRFKDVIFEDEQSTQELFSGLPVLEELELDNCLWKNIKTITINIPTLRRFTYIYDPPHLHYFLNCEIKIIAADLDYFYCSTYLLVQLFPCNISSLEYASVNIRDCFVNGEDGRRAMKLLAGLNKAKTLALSNATLKCLSDAENTQADLPIFHDLTYLKLISIREEHRYDKGRDATLIYILQKAPNLEAVSTGRDCKPYIHGWVAEIVSGLKSSLKSFIIRFFKGTEAEMRLLKYICENAPDLKRVDIFCLDGLNEDLKKQEEIRYQLQHDHGGDLTDFEIQFYDSENCHCNYGYDYFS